MKVCLSLNYVNTPHSEYLLSDKDIKRSRETKQDKHKENLNQRHKGEKEERY